MYQKELKVGEDIKIIRDKGIGMNGKKVFKGKVVAIFKDFMLIRHKNYLEAYLKKNFLTSKREINLYVKRENKYIEVDDKIMNFKFVKDGLLHEKN